MDEAIFEQAIADTLDLLGIEATFYPTEGNPAECNVAMVDEIAIQPGGFGLAPSAQGRNLYVQLSEIGDAEPVVGDRFEIASGKWAGTWKVTGPAIENNGFTALMPVAL